MKQSNDKFSYSACSLDISAKVLEPIFNLCYNLLTNSKARKKMIGYVSCKKESNYKANNLALWALEVCVLWFKRW